MRAFALSLLAFACACSDAASTDDVPRNQETIEAGAEPQVTSALMGRVIDHANILSASEEARLSMILEKLKRASGHQLVVVTVPTLGGHEIATFTRNLGNRWGIGRRGKDDGVILLVAPRERKVIIAVGQGLEKSLSNALCKRIIDERMLPRFRENDLSGGIDAGVQALVERLH